MKAYAQHGVWRYWGRTLLASAVVRYQLRFRLDVNIALLFCQADK